MKKIWQDVKCLFGFDGDTEVVYSKNTHSKHKCKNCGKDIYFLYF